MSAFTGSFTAVEQVSATLFVRKNASVEWILAGTFVGTFKLEEIVPNAGFKPLSGQSATTTSDLTWLNDTGRDLLVRVRCSAYTSGTANYTLQDVTSVVDDDSASFKSTFYDKDGNAVMFFDESGAVRVINALYIAGVQQGVGAGTGDVVGPSLVVDNAVARFDGTTGKLIQTSSVIISDAGVITCVGDSSVGSIILQPTTANNNAGAICFKQVASSGKYNWLVGADIINANTFAFSASTAADGTTFSTSAFKIGNTGNCTVGGTLAINGTGETWGSALGTFAISSTAASGTDTSAATGIISIQCSQGTGTGAGGTLRIQVAPVGSTGSSANTLVTSFLANTDGTLALGWSGLASTKAHTLNGNIKFDNGAGGTVQVRQNNADGAVAYMGGNSLSLGASVRVYGQSHATKAGVTEFQSDTTVNGSITNAGLWTLGPSGSTGAHTVNGSLSVTTGIIAASAALATSATSGFFQVTSCAGAATGALTNSTGVVGMVADTTNSRAYFRIGSTWKFSQLSTTADVETIDALVETAANKTYVLRTYAKYACTIFDCTIATSSGTCTVAIKINSTSVTSLSSLSVTSTPQTVASTGASSVVAGDAINMVVSSNSTALDLQASIKLLRV